MSNSEECIDEIKSWVEYVNIECDFLKKYNTDTNENRKIYLAKLIQFKTITDCNIANLKCLIDRCIENTMKNISKS